jgi:hypothetical protein
MGGVFFRAVAAECTPAAALTDEISEQQKTGDLKNRPPVKLFLRLLLTPCRSFHTASRYVRTPDTAHTLLDRLHKAVAYDKLHAEGKIELGYAHKLANAGS